MKVRFHCILVAVGSSRVARLQSKMKQICPFGSSNPAHAAAGVGRSWIATFATPTNSGQHIARAPSAFNTQTPDQIKKKNFGRFLDKAWTMKMSQFILKLASFLSPSSKFIFYHDFCYHVRNCVPLGQLPHLF